MSDPGAVRGRFNSLSVSDLLEAREAYHVHLAHQANVVATAVGRYRIRASDPDARAPRPDDSDVPAGLGPEPRLGAESSGSPPEEPPRTLANSVVRAWSWPCVLVFVDRWLSRAEFARDPDQMVPRRLYLPDGRVVPTCVVYAEDGAEAPEVPTGLSYPGNLIGGGYSITAEVQGRTRAGSIACLVTDGDSTYALTNRHVAGPAGRAAFTRLGEEEVRIGTSHPLQAGRLTFAEAYPGWPGHRSLSNVDAGLILIEDLSLWTAQVYRVGALGPLVDLNVDTIALDLIGTPVRAHGASSGPLRGEIQALFYRYRSVGGFDYVADLLIGPRHGEPEAMPTRPGDSGTLWVVDAPQPAPPDYPSREAAAAAAMTVPAPAYRPIAVQWGGHVRTDRGTGRQFRYALATNLSTLCRALDVDVLRGWNSGLPEFWGAVGHYTIGAVACSLASSPGLARLMKANVDRVSFDEATILNGSVNPGGPDPFFLLADVPDTVWKRGSFRRGKENPNHFADMDEPGKGGFSGRDLFSLTETPDGIDIATWNDFYASIPVAPNRRGSLPFRAWQVYAEMVAAARSKDAARFVAAAGILAHYVGDACQPLHASRLHDGDPDIPGSDGVHSSYETAMIGRFRAELFAAVRGAIGGARGSAIAANGPEAAAQVVALMRRTAATLPPAAIIASYVGNSHRVAKMWADLKEETAAVIADGCLTLASLWEGAWAAGEGERIPEADLKPIAQGDLRTLYQDTSFLPSLYLTEMAARADLFPTA